ncbi:MAG: shikimate kinase [Methanobacteriota archaeon]|nr:MAG: shikimate kinase [Euryarchaeota archaeon]
MMGKAACRGAGTIVNAIASGRGAAFGLSLETDVRADLAPRDGDVSVVSDHGGEGLLAGCVRRAAVAVGLGGVTGRVEVASEIPVSRGLKSSSAVSNAAVLSALRSLGRDLPDDAVLSIGVDESIRAGVTVTGAFDDAAACFHGGVVVTDNRRRKILRSDRLPDGLTAVILVPSKKIPKDEVDAERFVSRADEFEEAVGLALRGEFAEAIRLNSMLCAEVLELSDEAAEAARASGAYAAGITGTGPATLVLCTSSEVDAVAEALRRFEGDIITAGLNHTCSREVVPRLLS